MTLLFVLHIPLLRSIQALVQISKYNYGFVPMIGVYLYKYFRLPVPT